MSVSPAFGNERIAQKHWQLGRKILLDVLKKNRNVSNYIIRTLCNYILTKEQSSQYIGNSLVLLMFISLLLIWLIF